VRDSKYPRLNTNRAQNRRDKTKKRFNLTDTRGKLAQTPRLVHRDVTAVVHLNLEVVVVKRFVTIVLDAIARFNQLG